METGGGCTVVVPCYNEAARLRTDEFLLFVRGQDGIRFLFVDDGSSDGTRAVLEGMRAEAVKAGRGEAIRILPLERNQGKAEAVRLGLLAAMDAGGAEFVGFWDADLATPLDAVPELLGEFGKNANLLMVFGARVRLLGRAVHRKASRHYLGRVFATVASSLLQLPIYDTQCGAKLFRVTDEFREILAWPFLSRWVFDVEILARFIARDRKDLRHVQDAIFEYPLHRWEDVEGSKVRPVDFLHAFGDVLKIYRAYLK